MESYSWMLLIYDSYFSLTRFKNFTKTKKNIRVFQFSWETRHADPYGFVCFPNCSCNKYMFGGKLFNGEKIMIK